MFSGVTSGCSWSHPRCIDLGIVVNMTTCLGFGFDMMCVPQILSTADGSDQLWPKNRAPKPKHYCSFTSGGAQDFQEVSKHTSHRLGGDEDLHDSVVGMLLSHRTEECLSVLANNPVGPNLQHFSMPTVSRNCVFQYQPPLLHVGNSQTLIFRCAG